MNREKKVKLFDCLMSAVNKTTEKTGLKIVKIKRVPFRNICLKAQQVATDIYILGREGSDKPLIINKLKLSLISNKNKCRYISLRARLCHPNTSDASESYGTPLLFGNLSVELHGQVFCNPVTSHHVLNIEGVENILIGQLSGISDDAYGCPDSCSVDDIDKPISTEDYTILKKNANILQLITRHSEIDNDTILDFRSMDIPKSDDEIMVKFLDDSYYTCINKASLDRDSISSYYPIITYADICKVNTEVPRKAIDVGVFGVGSGGTAILDQIGRSTYFKSYLLNDMDTVERKNLNNQWYTQSKIGSCKTTASGELLKAINPNTYSTLSIDTRSGRYESLPIANFEFKYAISGFDTITTRKRLLSDCKEGKLVSKFLIDCRYLDNECSIYFIDLSNPSEVDYYERLLNADGDALSDESFYITDSVEFISWFREHGYFDAGCSACLIRLGMTDSNYNACTNEFVCGGTSCIDFLVERFDAVKPTIKLSSAESSCIRQNYIDIYKFVGSVVFSAIREIESERPKPFTHIECQSFCIPSLVVVRK